MAGPRNTAATADHGQVPETTSAARAAPGRRVPALDVLRGIAILGTLASNVWIFTSELGIVTRDGNPTLLETVSMWAPNGKFLGLLTIMFGIGLEIQRQAALRAGRKWPGKYPVRALLLFLDGLLNYILVVQFDVLRAYAVTGFLVAFLLLTSERVQWWLAGFFISLHLTILAVNSRMLSTDSGSEPLPEELLKDIPRAGEAMFGYWEQVRLTVLDLPAGFHFQSEFFTIVLMGIGTFLVGAKLYRIGIFDPARRTLRRWLIAAGFLIALPLDYALSHGLGGPAFAGHARYGTATVVALGILALVAEFYQSRQVGRVGRLLGFVGKMALSCYLLQNIIGVLFQRTAGRSDLLQHIDNLYGTYATFIAISAILIVFSALWLRRFERGPFELVWNWCYRKITRE